MKVCKKSENNEGKAQLYIPHGSDESKSAGIISIKREVLYIPHGSDERVEFILTLDESEQLYIPHGSDESDYRIAHPADIAGLYIPHGSDERAGALSFGCPITTFISHMVQMKGIIERVGSLNKQLFISHMVQMKEK